MRIAGLRGMRRALIIAGVIVCALALAACGGAAAQKPALGNDIVEHVDVAADSGVFHTPLDSAPDPEGTTVYFTASGASGPGVFSVPAGGGQATQILAGSPFVAPGGIAVSSDGKQIFVADPQASDGGNTGLIFSIPVGGSAATPLSGSAGAAPRGMDVVREGDQDMVYFTGKDPASGQAAVLKLPAAGGALTVVAKGAPLVDPDGVTVTRAGVVYVTDHSAGQGGSGSVFKISGGTVAPIVAQVRTGSPAGVAMTLDESVLLVSALQPDRDSDQVLLVDLTSLQTGSLTKVIEQNQKAGGVHRAHNKNVFSWADLTAGTGGGGRVFVIR